LASSNFSNDNCHEPTRASRPGESGQRIRRSNLKDILNARGYRWNPDGTPFPKAWFIDVTDDRREAELSFLRKELYQREINPLTRKIDAFSRFSDRI